MKGTVAGIGMLALFLGMGAGILRAQEQGQAEAQVQAPARPSAQAPAAPEPDYTFGVVKSVAADQIVITEFDYDTEKEVEAAYQIDPQVQLGDVASLQEIKAGDEVDIDYVTRDGKKVAVGIFVSKPLGGEEEPAE